MAPRRTRRRAPSHSPRPCDGAWALPVVLQDERLTSVEAEQRLAVREKDWRRRKAKLDAAAAAIILQEYLDRPLSRSSDAPA